MLLPTVRFATTGGESSGSDYSWAGSYPIMPGRGCHKQDWWSVGSFVKSVLSGIVGLPDGDGERRLNGFHVTAAAINPFTQDVGLESSA